jgi:GIY-YIG catalytic domain
MLKELLRLLTVDYIRELARLFFYSFVYTFFYKGKDIKYIGLTKNLQRLYVNITIFIIQYGKVYILIFWIILLLKIKSYSFIITNKINNINDKLINLKLKQDKDPVTPQKIYIDINKISTIKKIEMDLKDLKGIYGFYCKINNNTYIGSSENLVKRFKEHIKGNKSNIKLQRAINKYGLNNFYFLIFEFFDIKDKIKLIDFENFYITSFDFRFLYNFKSTATSMLGYKHTIESKIKMVN